MSATQMYPSVMPSSLFLNFSFLCSLLSVLTSSMVEEIAGHVFHPPFSALLLLSIQECQHQDSDRLTGLYTLLPVSWSGYQLCSSQ